jgi:VRR-NUC domain
MRQLTAADYNAEVMRRMSEKVWTAHVHAALLATGWRHYHTWLSVRSAPGFPDVVAVRPPRLIIAELKRVGGRLTVAQRQWVAELAALGPPVEVYVWTPADRDEMLTILQ